MALRVFQTRHHGFAESAAGVAAVVALAAAFVLFAGSFIWMVALIAAVGLLRLAASRVRSPFGHVGKPPLGRHSHGDWWR